MSDLHVYCRENETREVESLFDYRNRHSCFLVPKLTFSAKPERKGKGRPRGWCPQGPGFSWQSMAGRNWVCVERCPWLDEWGCTFALADMAHDDLVRCKSCDLTGDGLPVGECSAHVVKKGVSQNVALLCVVIHVMILSFHCDSGNTIQSLSLKKITPDLGIPIAAHLSQPAYLLFSLLLVLCLRCALLHLSLSCVYDMVVMPVPNFIDKKKMQWWLLRWGATEHYI